MNKQSQLLERFRLTAWALCVLFASLIGWSVAAIAGFGLAFVIDLLVVVPVSCFCFRALVSHLPKQKLAFQTAAARTPAQSNPSSKKFSAIE